jgi:NAD(P)-dependent dehydrogenase (short-subunit alcohol dehydrogenase family)
LLDLDPDAVAAAAADIGPRHRGYACDVTDKAACERVAQAMIGDLGRADVLVNNAGISRPLRLM